VLEYDTHPDFINQIFWGKGVHGIQLIVLAFLRRRGLKYCLHKKRTENTYFSKKTFRTISHTTIEYMKHSLGTTVLCVRNIMPY
jgi:hypothetical protein